jgi:hypothetical protein
LLALIAIFLRMFLWLKELLHALATPLGVDKLKSSEKLTVIVGKLEL